MGQAEEELPDNST